MIKFKHIKIENNIIYAEIYLTNGKLLDKIAYDIIKDE